MPNQPTNNTFLKSAAAALISCIIFFSIAEFGARIYITRYGNALEVSHPILEADAVLGWKGRPNLHTTFLHLPLDTDAAGWRTHELATLPAGKKIILVLGPSSAFGWGAKEEDTYSNQLEALLATSSGAIVLNAGEIGYSTLQGVKLFNQAPAATLKAKVVMIAYGVNDLDRSRFYFQSSKDDAQEFAQPESQSKTDTENNLASSALLETLFDIAAKVREPLTMPPVASYPANPVPGVRVTLPDFLANMQTLIDTAKARGESPVVLSTFTNLPEASMSAEAAAAFSAAKNAWVAGNLVEAQKDLLQAVSADPHLCDAYYYLASLAMHNGNGSDARKYFALARDNESYRISADVATYDTALQALAAKNNVPYFDIAAAFAGHDKNSLFVDPIHFSPSGNALVAKGLEDIIESNKLLQ